MRFIRHSGYFLPPAPTDGKKRSILIEKDIFCVVWDSERYELSSLHCCSLSASPDWRPLTGLHCLTSPASSSTTLWQSCGACGRKYRPDGGSQVRHGVCVGDSQWTNDAISMCQSLSCITGACRAPHARACGDGHLLYRAARPPSDRTGCGLAVTSSSRYRLHES